MCRLITDLVLSKVSYSILAGRGDGKSRGVIGAKLARAVQGACLDDQKMLLITEFCEGGDLIKAIAKRQISWKKR